MTIQQVEGMRIGLTTKKRLVELMRGREFMGSTPDQGTCFKSALACAGNYFFQRDQSSSSSGLRGC